MSALETRRAIQRLLVVKDDGVIGPKSRAALERLIAAPDDSEWPPAVIVPPQTPPGEIDARSAATIATLHPRVQPHAKALILLAAKNGIQIKAISGLRTYAEQDALYEQGRSKPGPIVTNARGGFSSHNFATAFDIGVFEGAKYIPESHDYATVGKLGKSLGLAWGGDWSSPDEPHHYLKPEWAEGLSESQMMTGLRKRHDDGKDVFTT